MGNKNSGRRPQPTPLRILRGNPGKRPINPHEPALPVVDATFDQPPAELVGDELAIKEWRRAVPLVRAMRIMTAADWAVMVGLCNSWSRYLSAQAKLRSAGMFVKKHTGEPMVNPAIRVGVDALAECRAAWIELGLTPSARARLSAAPADGSGEATKWAGLL